MANAPSASNSAERLVLLADWVVGAGGEVTDSVALALTGGRICEMFDSHGSGRRWAERHGAQALSLPGEILAPGWVNAHYHLELTGLADRIPCQGGFPAWIGRLMAAKKSMTHGDYLQGVKLGAQRLLESGTTSVGDIDSQAVGGDVGSPIGMVLYREALDAFHAHRTDRALAWVEKPLPARDGMAEGLAPHASFTVSPALMAGMARLASSRNLPVTVHWSETRAEIDWLQQGTGALADVLGPSPGCSGLDILEEAGLLAPHVSLVHGNHPQACEPERIAAAGATVVHCPGSHLFFGREEFPLDRYLDAGVSVALGTDSQASNGALHMGREVGLLRKSFPQVDARLAFAMGTEHGARALGWADRVGKIETGFRADLVCYGAPGVSRADVLERLTRETLPVAGVWVAGKQVI